MISNTPGQTPYGGPEWRWRGKFHLAPDFGAVFVSSSELKRVSKHWKFVVEMVPSIGQRIQMKYLRAKLIRIVTDYFGSDDKRIEHALRVLHHADCIAADHPGCDMDILIASALLHDVGIKVSEEKHGYNTGKTQEEYGPPVAEALLDSIGFPSDKTEIVKKIIGNHHSPPRYDYPELKVLRKADRIVNRDEK